MPALLTRMSRRPESLRAAPSTKARHAASLPTSACVKAILAPVGFELGRHPATAVAVAIAERHARALGDEKRLTVALRSFPRPHLSPRRPCRRAFPCSPTFHRVAKSASSRPDPRSIQPIVRRSKLPRRDTDPVSAFPISRGLGGPPARRPSPAPPDCRRHDAASSRAGGPGR